MNAIPEYPNFSDLSLKMMEEIVPRLTHLPDGVSEFTFVGLYLFRKFYKYKIALKNNLLIIVGEKKGKKFFITPCCKIDPIVAQELLKTYDYWKLLSESFIDKNKSFFEKNALAPKEDRANFDYVYSREDLATLRGKKFHKKKNHINTFETEYPDREIKALTEETISDALVVLEHWASTRDDLEKTDYESAKEALTLIDYFNMKGLLLYVGGIPVAWCLGEPVSNGKMIAVHFEKARTDYKGSYQYVNFAFAQYLPETVESINREQDLGDEGLRQAKMTYRPIRFVKKYKVCGKSGKRGSNEISEHKK